MPVLPANSGRGRVYLHLRQDKIRMFSLTFAVLVFATLPRAIASRLFCAHLAGPVSILVWIEEEKLFSQSRKIFTVTNIESHVIESIALIISTSLDIWTIILYACLCAITFLRLSNYVGL